MPDEKPSALIHYKKTDAYRSYHVDGAMATLRPGGGIYVELFLERATTPRSVRYALGEQNQLAEELERETISGFIRQIECGLVLDIGAAIALHETLFQQIRKHYQREQSKLQKPTQNDPDESGETIR